MGDSSDNILGYDYKARSKVPKFLEPKISELMDCSKEEEMYDIVADMYAEYTQWSDDWSTRMHTNGKCLWIWRKHGDLWQPPNERNNQSLNQD